jgi:multidrug efflux system membrane fusion protein
MTFPQFSPRQWLIGLAATALLVLFFLWRGGPESQNHTAKNKGAGMPISVRTEKARRGDFDIHLNALGTVTPINTTTVKSRVTGELLKIYFKEGDYVKAGEPLAEVDPRIYQSQLDQALGKIDSDRAQLKFAEAELARDEHLIQEGYIALSQLQTQSASVNQLKGMIATDQGQIDAARVQLSFCHIVAPLSGRLGLKQVDLGNILNVLDPVVIITQMQPISVVFSIPQDFNGRLQEKMRTTPDLAIEAYDRDGRNLIAQGRIASADNLIDTTTGTLRIKARFDNQDLALYPNQFVNVRLLLETLPDRIIVPRKAVQQDPKGYHVFGLNPDETVKTIPVMPGVSEGEEMVIESGLADGETVITEGLDKLRDGSKVIPPGKKPELPAEGSPQKHRKQ